MNDHQLENKVRKDTARVKKDLSALMVDSTARISRVQGNFNQATGKVKEDVNTWVDDSVSQLGEGLEKLAGDAKESVVDTAAVVKKDVGRGLSQYNAKAQEVANKIPGDFGKKAAKYPWVAISLALLVGFVLGGLLKPSRLLLG
ncbi:MAG: hypothetical protein P4L50_19350 [Anaerolineaceae bacterium]|nr:hypothetical protein [Anaerolineaceae bacterium]